MTGRTTKYTKVTTDDDLSRQCLAEVCPSDAGLPTVSS